MYIIYGKKGCQNCEKAKNLLESKGLTFEYLILDVDYTKENLVSLCPIPPRELPQIFKIKEIGIVYVGNFNDLQKSLDPLTNTQE